MPAGQENQVVLLFPDSTPVVRSPIVEELVGARSAKIIQWPWNFPVAERKLGYELDALDSWQGQNVRRAEVLLAGTPQLPEIEVFCRRSSGRYPDEIIVDAMPTIEISGRESLRIKCAVKQIKLTKESIALFLIVSPAYEITYRESVLRAMPTVQFVYVDLPGPRRITLANAHFDRKYGDLRRHQRSIAFR